MGAAANVAVVAMMEDKMRLLWLIAVLCISVAPARAQIAVEQAMGATSAINTTPLVRDRQVSAPNTPLTVVYDLASANQVLEIHMACALGTATLTVQASSDNTNFLTIDTSPAASPIVKIYNNSTVGSTGVSTALSPLAFRWVKITAGFCPSGTSTLTVAAK
jgi:hypothetical protein